MLGAQATWTVKAFACDAAKAAKAATAIAESFIAVSL
jgi:hypothetical protein